MYELLSNNVKIEDNSQISNPLRIEDNIIWKSYVLIQIILWYFALSSYDIAKQAALFSVVLSLSAALFMPMSYAIFSIVCCVFLGPWFTKSLIDVRIPAGNFQTLIALAGLYRFLPIFMKQKFMNFPMAIVVGIILLLGMDFTNALRGYMPPNFITLSGHYIRFISVVICMYVAGCYHNRREVHLFSLAVLGAAYILGASVALNTLSFNVTTLSELSDARSSGLTDPNYALTGAAFWLLSCLSFMVRSRIHKITKIVFGIAFFYGIYFVGVGASRTAAIALFAGLSILLLYIRKKRVQIFALAFCCMLAVWSVLPDIYIERLTGEQAVKLENRVPVYENAYQEFMNHPFFGSGQSTYFKKWNAQTNLAAHNTVLHLLAEGGIINAGIYIAVIIMLLRFGWQRFRQDRGLYITFFISFLIAYLIAANGLNLLFWGNQIGLIFSSIVALTMGHFTRCPTINSVEYDPEAVTR